MPAPGDRKYSPMRPSPVVTPAVSTPNRRSAPAAASPSALAGTRLAMAVWWPSRAKPTATLASAPPT